jgi:hypothetical protein
MMLELLRSLLLEIFQVAVIPSMILRVLGAHGFAPLLAQASGIFWAPYIKILLIRTYQVLMLYLVLVDGQMDLMLRHGLSITTSHEFFHILGLQLLPWSHEIPT